MRWWIKSAILGLCGGQCDGQDSDDKQEVLS